MKQTINVYDITQKIAVDYELGNRVYSLIRTALKKNGKIIIDFKGVEIILASFLSSMSNLSKQDWSNIKIINLPNSAKVLIKAIRNVK